MNVKADPRTDAAATALSLIIGRLNHYYAAMAVTLVTNVVLLALILHFGPGMSGLTRWMVTPLIVSVAAFGVLGGKAAIEDAAAATRDFAAGSTSEAAKPMASKPFGLFISLTVVLIAAVNLALLVLLFSL